MPDRADAFDEAVAAGSCDGGGAPCAQAGVETGAETGAGAAAGTAVVEAFTDGACSGNPGPGGWGVLLRWRGTEKELCGGEPETTNNRMELMAAIQALEALRRPLRVCLYTDSQYVKNGITAWMARWKANGWRTAGRDPVKNKDLWQRLDALVGRHKVEFRWVRGHAGHPENERADSLARRGLESGRAGRRASRPPSSLP